jgi:hypothetical protein
MTAVTMVAIERTGPAIRAALAAHAPEDEAGFVAELRNALARADRISTWPGHRPCCVAGTPAL